MAAAMLLCRADLKHGLSGVWMPIVPLTASFFCSLQFAGGTEMGEMDNLYAGGQSCCTSGLY